MTYKHGGVQFFLPYIMSVVFVGIPLLIMELGLGQKFQRGANIVFRSINGRLAGVGFAQAFACFMITTYYNVILA